MNLRRSILNVQLPLLLLLPLQFLPLQPWVDLNAQPLHLLSQPLLPALGPPHVLEPPMPNQLQFSPCEKWLEWMGWLKYTSLSPYQNFLRYKVDWVPIPLTLLPL